MFKGGVKLKEDDDALAEIRRAVCRRYGFSESVFDGPNVSAAKAKRVAAYLGRRFTQKSILELQNWLGVGNFVTVLQMMNQCGAKVDKFRANAMMADLKSQTMIGFDCASFFSRKNGVEKMPWAEYVDLFVALIGDV